MKSRSYEKAVDVLAQLLVQCIAPLDEDHRRLLQILIKQQEEEVELLKQGRLLVD